MPESKTKFFGRFSAVLGALVFLQLPLVIQQYQMRLAGHVAELRYQVYLLKETALQSGKSLDEFIQKFTSSSDVDFSRQGELMQAMVTRMEEQTSALMALQQSFVLTKPWVFFYRLDFSILKSTLYSFEFGLSVTFESALYALIGAACGYYIYQLIRRLIARIRGALSHDKK